MLEKKSYHCQPEVSKRTIVPFVKDEKGYKYPGLKKIEAFVKQRLEQANS